MRAESPHALALLRIVLAVLFVVSPELWRAPQLAEHPELLGSVPEVLAWFGRGVPSVALVHGLQVVVVLSAATTLVGYRTRLSLVVLVLSALPVYALSQRLGTVRHDAHYFWFAALLATGPSGEAWAVDARGRPARPSREAATTLRLARLLLGAIYLFPGLHKAIAPDGGWWTGASLLHHLHGKWFQEGAVPSFRLDEIPGATRLAGWATLAFELSFLPLASWRRTRLVALGAGLCFHLLAQWWLHVPFVGLWACYVILLPVGPRGPCVRWQSGWQLWAFVPLFVGVCVQGIRGQTLAWPIGCYPTFSYDPTAYGAELVVEHDGAFYTGRERRARSWPEWATVYRLADRHQPVDPALVRLHVRRVLGADTPTAKLYRASAATDPARWQEPPRRLECIAGCE